MAPPYEEVEDVASYFPEESPDSSQGDDIATSLERLWQNNQAEIQKLQEEQERGEPSTANKILRSLVAIGVPALVGAAVGGKRGALSAAGYGTSAYGNFLEQEEKSKLEADQAIRKARLDSIKSTQKALQDIALLPERERVKANAQVEAFKQKAPLYERLARLNAGQFDLNDPALEGLIAKSALDSNIVETPEDAAAIAKTSLGARLVDRFSDNERSRKSQELKEREEERKIAKVIVGPGVVLSERSNINEKEAPKLRDLLGVSGDLFSRLDQVINTVRENIKRNGKLVYTDDLKGDLQRQSVRVIGSINALEGYGQALTGREFGLIIRQVFAIPQDKEGFAFWLQNQVFRRNPLTNLVELRKELETSLKEKLGHSGIGLNGIRYSKEEANRWGLGDFYQDDGTLAVQDLSGLRTTGKEVVKASRERSGTPLANEVKPPSSLQFTVNKDTLADTMNKIILDSNISEGSKITLSLPGRGPLIVTKTKNGLVSERRK